jgi:hypothetical protein
MAHQSSGFDVRCGSDSEFVKANAKSKSSIERLTFFSGPLISAFAKLPAEK